jgi:zinc protease
VERSRAIFLSLVAVLVESSLLAQTAPPSLPAGITKGATVEGITEYTLRNGLRVLLFPDTTKTTTTVNMTYLVGSRNENYGETGMAHLLEHMVFKGSPRHTNIMQELTEHGTRPNGSTSFDRTNYFETFQSTDQNLEWALDLESDRMVNSFIAKKDLDREMTVVRNELEMGENNPASVLQERVFSTAYLWHNYGKTTIGARSDIENVPIERLQAFYRLYYQPDNAVLTIAGRVDEAKTLGLIAHYFGSLPKPSRVLQKTYTEEPAQDGERSVTLRRVGDVKVMLVGVHVPALAHPDGPLANIITEVFTNAPSGRLYKALVETKKAGFAAGESTDSREPGLMLFFAQGPKTADLDDIRSTFLQVLDGISQIPFTSEEVNRAKTKYSSQFDLLFRDSERLGLFLSEYIAAGDWRLAFISRDRIREATVEDVNRFAKTYLTPSNRTIGLFIPTEKPERADVPAAPAIADVVRNYKGDAAMAQGEAFDPSPANIDKRIIRTEVQPGIKLALINKKTRGNVVHASVRFHFGSVESLKDKDSVAALTGQMLMRGTTAHTRQQIADEFDRLKAQVRVFGTGSSANVSIQTTKDNFPAVLKLVAEVLRQPAFPEPEFEALKQQQLTTLENHRREPEAIAFQNAERHLRPYPKGDIRYTATVEEEIEDVKAMKLEDVKHFYKDFYGVAAAELSVVGEFDSEALPKEVSTLFEGWKSSAKYVRVPLEFKNLPTSSESSETPDKSNAVFVAVQPLQINDEDPQYPALVLANYMLGGGFLNSRLATRIRVKDGLSYGVGSQLEVPTKDEAGAFMTYAICAPQNTAKVEADFFEELKRAIDGGFREQEIAAAKSGWLQSRQVSRGQDNELAARLASQAYWSRTMQWDATLEQKVSALKASEINAALKRFIDPSRISIFKAGDFAKVRTAQTPPDSSQKSGTNQ